MINIKIEDVTIQYDSANVRIIDSYLVTDKKKMVLILRLFLNITGYKSQRSLKSWLKEWKSHNRLYRLGLFKSHTVDCDLEENEKWWRLLAYQILGV